MCVQLGDNLFNFHYVFRVTKQTSIHICALLHAFGVQRTPSAFIRLVFSNSTCGVAFLLYNYVRHELGEYSDSLQS